MAFLLECRFLKTYFLDKSFHIIRTKQQCIPAGRGRLLAVRMFSMFAFFISSTRFSLVFQWIFYTPPPPRYNTIIMYSPAYQ